MDCRGRRLGNLRLKPALARHALRLRDETSARQISENGVDGDQDEERDDRGLPSTPYGLPGIETEDYERDREKKVAP